MVVMVRADWRGQILRREPKNNALGNARVDARVYARVNADGGGQIDSREPFKQCFTPLCFTRRCVAQIDAPWGGRARRMQAPASGELKFLIS